MSTLEQTSHAECCIDDWVQEGMHDKTEYTLNADQSDDQRATAQTCLSNLMKSLQSYLSVFPRLKERLRNAEYPDELEREVGWKYEAYRWAVKPYVNYWFNNYDWEKPRAELNRWHHYQVTIQDLRLHFVHEPSSQPGGAVPLVLINGWPSNFP
ncbi:epoxide hydrolase N terminus-domain-containing protein [Zychaea mexicana]|uniref:epoxide hydrolase N terminus-domain-containing protein n=1 Tax=Zychaea mexicana TaxID=64656 RepID=UPI0022FEE295|nr:epoxide hydrolase N terminus-domain-containing protein [Zychaea mexicana]KAI9493382.1 epoxide hydrolase N terminus-domain-containing protein [Zychaea mexicana]